MGENGKGVDITEVSPRRDLSFCDNERTLLNYLSEGSLPPELMRTMTEAELSHWQFFTCCKDSKTVTLLYHGEIVAQIALGRTKHPLLVSRSDINISEVIPVLSDHLMGQPDIKQVYDMLDLKPTPEELEADTYARRLLHYSLEYSLTDRPASVDLSEIALVRRAYTRCPPKVNSSVKKDFALWLAWLKFRFGNDFKPGNFEQFISLLSYFEGRGYDYFRELATIAVAVHKDRSFPILLALASWFHRLSRTHSQAERDNILERLILERTVPPGVENLNNDTLVEICEHMQKNEWGGYVLQNIYDSNMASPGMAFSLKSVGIVLSQCMIGLGDMALFIALVKAFEARYPDKVLDFYLFQGQDQVKLETLWPEAHDLEGRLHLGLTHNVRSRIQSSDVVIYSTTPWSYQNGINPVLEGPKGKVTVYLPGLDWNRTQGYLRRYPDGRMEMMLPIGLSPHALVNPLDILFPKEAETARPTSSAVIRGRTRMPRQLSTYPKGAIYTSYDAAVLRASVHFLAQMKKNYERFVYFTFIRKEDFSARLLRDLGIMCGEHGIHFCDVANLPANHKRYLLVDLGPLSQKDFNAVLEETELPSLVTGTVTVYQFLRRGKLFFHLGNHPNSRVLKLEIETSLFAAWKEGYLGFEEYQMLVEYFNLFRYRYHSPADPFVLSELDMSRFSTPGFMQMYRKWLDFLRSSKPSFFECLEALLSTGTANRTASPALETSAGTPTFETVYDDEATNIWNQYRFGVSYLGLSPDKALARVLEKNTIQEVERACRRLRDNPYRQRFNDLLAATLNTYVKS